MITYFCLVGFIVIGAFCLYLRYAYELTNHNKYISIFSSINNSIWEHIKIIIYPTLIWSIIELPILGSNGNFIFAIILNVFVSCSFVYVFHLVNNLVFEKPNDYFEIIGYTIAIAIGQFVSFLVLSITSIISLPVYISIIFIVICTIICFLLHIYIPQNYFFQDPVTLEYGKDGHNCKNNKEKEQ